VMASTSSLPNTIHTQFRFRGPGGSCVLLQVA
jgi:hypothetical protein